MSDLLTRELSLAIRFHETYERLAPQFGYETRTETRQFDPTTPNGQLMVAVCKELLLALRSEPEPQQGDLAPTSSGSPTEQHDTPRTDALAVADIIISQSRLLGADRYKALLDHARQLERENTTLLSALTCADEWVSTRACGDNCFVSNRSDGDPGARCNCGRASVIDAIIVAYDAVSSGNGSRERLKTASKPNSQTAVGPWPVGSYLKEEMDERGWTVADVAVRMGWSEHKDIAVNELTIDLMLHVNDQHMVLGTETAYALGKAFGVSPQMWINLDAAHRAARARATELSSEDAKTAPKENPC